MEAIPRLPGSYILHLKLPEPVHLVIGRLGDFDFPVGHYFYLGSAHGPGGLRGRLGHHLRAADHPHWHIDYLRAEAVLTGCWYALGMGRLECAWSRTLLGFPGITVPAPGFGAADCQSGCRAHLVTTNEDGWTQIAESALLSPLICVDLSSSVA